MKILYKMVARCFDLDLCIIRDDYTLPPIRIQEHIDNISDAKELGRGMLNHHRYTNKITNECYELSPSEEHRIAVALYTTTTKNKTKLRRVVTLDCIISFVILLLACCVWGFACASIFQPRISLMFTLTGALILGYFNIPPIMSVLTTTWLED